MCSNNKKPKMRNEKGIVILETKNLKNVENRINK